MSQLIKITQIRVKLQKYLNKISRQQFNEEVTKEILGKSNKLVLQCY